MRLDNFIFRKNFVESRNKASELIKNSKVKVGGVIINKPSFQVNSPKIEILEKNIYVSRAAEKLKLFLNTLDIPIQDKLSLDIGSSTGGFVQILLENGAKEVCAVDVGKDQLHDKLKSNPRVKSFEGTDVRNFMPSNILFDIVTCDVSFVGIEYILPDIDRLAKDYIIILFKPQFEVGKGVKRDKRGVVKDEKAIISALNKFENLSQKFYWNLIKKEDSQVKGKEGNVETFYCFRKRQN